MELTFYQMLELIMNLSLLIDKLLLVLAFDKQSIT